MNRIPVWTAPLFGVLFAALWILCNWISDTLFVPAMLAGVAIFAWLIIQLRNLTYAAWVWWFLLLGFASFAAQIVILSWLDNEAYMKRLVLGDIGDAAGIIYIFALIISVVLGAFIPAFGALIGGIVQYRRWRRHK